eukprot:jgi/Mesvir1/27415/Mv07212-RA.1
MSSRGRPRGLGGLPAKVVKITHRKQTCPSEDIATSLTSLEAVPVPGSPMHWLTPPEHMLHQFDSRAGGIAEGYASMQAPRGFIAGGWAGCVRSCMDTGIWRALHG